jgi:Tfp pilus assembly protein PilZ
VNASHRPAPRYPTSLKVALPGFPGPVPAEATNISATGMFVRTDSQLAVGAVVSLAIELPDDARPVPVNARVIHVRSRAQSRAARLEPGVGVQFVGDDLFQTRVEQYIDSIPRKSSVPAVRLLSQARDLLAVHGWTQLVEKDPAGSYCLSGALLEAAGEDDVLYRRALRTLGERLNVPACSLGGFGCHCAIVSWNDALGRTRFEVLEKLDEVIRAELTTAPPVTP